MFSKLVTRRAPFHSAAARKFFEYFLIGLASLKFPEGTVAGMYKQAVASNSEYDIVRFDTQKLNWTLKEFDVSSLSVLLTFI